MSASLRPSLALITPRCLLACSSDPATPDEAPNDAPVCLTACLDGQLGTDGECVEPLAACGVEVAP
jgi:hypothetical protein